MYSAVRWKKYVHVSVPAISQNQLEKIGKLGTGKKIQYRTSLLQMYISVEWSWWLEIVEK